MATADISGIDGESLVALEDDADVFSVWVLGWVSIVCNVARLAGVDCVVASLYLWSEWIWLGICCGEDTMKQLSPGNHWVPLCL